MKLRSALPPTLLLLLAPSLGEAAIPGATPVTSSKTVVWVFAHPDDEVLAAAGAIHEHEEVGKRNIVIVVDSGVGSQACNNLSFSDTQCRDARRYESRVAVASLGVAPADIIHLGWGTWTSTDLVTWLDNFVSNQLGLTASQISLKAHSPADHYAGYANGHPVHYRVASAIRTMNTRTINPFTDVRYYRIGHLYGAFTCGVNGEGRARYLSSHWHAIKLVAMSEYQQQNSAAGRYGIGGASVPSLWSQVANPNTPECWERPEDL